MYILKAVYFRNTLVVPLEMRV